MPENLADWLSEEHMVWFLLEVVEQMDLRGFVYGYNPEGCGNTAYHPQMMLALLLYSYCHGITSSREIEKLCETDVAFRVISAGQYPDHSTIARFRKKHRKDIKRVFLEVLRLCREAGLGKSS